MTTTLKFVDFEPVPVDQEARAAAWEARMLEPDEHLRPAFAAWVESGCFWTDGENLPDLEIFTDQYQGEFDDWSDFVEHLAAETVLLEVPERIHTYFDAERWGRDLKYSGEYDFAELPSGGIAVWRLC